MKWIAGAALAVLLCGAAACGSSDVRADTFKSTLKDRTDLTDAEATCVVTKTFKVFDQSRSTTSTRRRIRRTSTPRTSSGSRRIVPRDASTSDDVPVFVLQSGLQPDIHLRHSFAGHAGTRSTRPGIGCGGGERIRTAGLYVANVALSPTGLHAGGSMQHTRSLTHGRWPSERPICERDPTERGKCCKLRSVLEPRRPMEGHDPGTRLARDPRSSNHASRGGRPALRLLRHPRPGVEFPR